MSKPSEEKETPSDETAENKEIPSRTSSESASELKISSTNNNDLLPATLFRMTKGLPRRELNLMVVEATECEEQLQSDIALLEKALESGETDEATNELLQNVLTPLDKYWTASSLLGRLRDDWTLPSILVATEANESNENLNMLENQLRSPSSDRGAEKLIETLSNPIYTKEQPNTPILLGLWKKIYNHKASFVFKKPVRPEEAPGYIERIVFPMDLSMIRKLIVARTIKSYAELHQYIGLISHNCVKYNGRESEYGRVAREFEAAADELIRQAVENHGTEKNTIEPTITNTDNTLTADADPTQRAPNPPASATTQPSEQEAPTTEITAS
ncbi:hypothetical protein FisN_11Hu123 [Fistulifera solaris]|uniref:Bromo domain-containing protein n=1 Tax=Fistulifera solaris TaxID=1519565 RepID=A0A1Z5JKW1_FISSO|nr:hypothetical protein FisN_11Hu123 [Fistulifera solaris]|eukprot:GAX14418.1 hypothetical protein FisN_11Hu123 [Fistulifera solaris]